MPKGEANGYAKKTFKQPERYRHFAPFNADGRVTLTEDKVDYDRNLAPSARPIKVRVSNARQLIARFLSSGNSFHSGNGNVLWVLLAWAHANDHKIKIETFMHESQIAGYAVRLLK